MNENSSKSSPIPMPLDYHRTTFYALENIIREVAPTMVWAAMTKHCFMSKLFLNKRRMTQDFF